MLGLRALLGIDLNRDEPPEKTASAPGHEAASGAAPVSPPTVPDDIKASKRRRPRIDHDASTPDPIPMFDPSRPAPSTTGDAAHP